MLRIIAALLFLILSQLPASAEKRVALVIGNSMYKYAGALSNPKTDAGDIAAALQGAGFQVISAFDLDKPSFDRTIREFATALSNAEAGVFFYAGHGLQVSGKNYLMPTDARLSTAEALEFEMVQLDVVHRIMERQTATNVLFIDACRNNPLARNFARAMGAARSGETIGRGLAPVESGAGTLISFSTQPGNVALDGTGRNSPFAGALARRVTNSTEDLNSLLIDVRNDVLKETDGLQMPWEHSALTGRFYFHAPGPKTAALLDSSNQTTARSDKNKFDGDWLVTGKGRAGCRLIDWIHKIKITDNKIVPMASQPVVPGIVLPTGAFEYRYPNAANPSSTPGNYKGKLTDSAGTGEYWYPRACAGTVTLKKL